jgi:hypothetical protein
VEDIIKLPALHDYFKRVKKINQYWRSSDILLELLQSIVKELNKQPAALQLPGKTRWQEKLYTLNSNILNKIYMQQAILDKGCLSEKSDADVIKKYKRMREMILDKQY